MSLTLQLEEEVPKLYVTKIMSVLQPHEFVYHLNNGIASNFVKEPSPYKIVRKGVDLSFQWFSHKLDDEIEQYLVYNIAYDTRVLPSKQSLFGVQEEIETRNFLLPSSKAFHYHLISLSCLDQESFKSMQKQGLVRAFKNHEIKELKQTEQKVLQNIYYEKQS